MAYVGSTGSVSEMPRLRPRALPVEDLFTPPAPDAAKQAAMGSTIKFDIPPRCREFTPFARLPAEIRHQIWESTLSTPGMHFLKVQSSDKSYNGKWWAKSLGSPDQASSSSASEEDKDEDPVTLEIQRETRLAPTASASLVPLYPTPRADISYHTTLNLELTKLSVTCNESAAVVKRLLSRPSTLKLNGDRMISLDISSDIINLEYVPPDVFEDSFRFTKSLECAGLDKIRNVAVRYCHTWHEKHSPNRCSVCGRVHHAPDKVTYPNHLYHFLAQYLPNLENFYFVDYFILRKPDCKAGKTHPAAKMPVAKFEGGNRTYYEVDEHNWTINSKVFNTMSWLQDRFVRYARESKLSNHKNPDRVKFGVLACEWTVGQEVAVKPTQNPPIKKGRNKRTYGEEHSTRRSRHSPARKTPVPMADYASFEPEGIFSFVFSASGKNDFDFTFSAPRE